MGNCLVTKLKDVVDNSNLTKLGELFFDISSNVSTNTVKLYCPASVSERPQIRVVGDGTIRIKSDSTDTWEESTKNATLTLEWYTIEFSAGVYRVFISNKYNLYITGAWGNLENKYGLYLNTSELKYTTILNYTHMRNIYLTGNLNELKFSPSVTEFNVCATDISGDIKDFVSLLPNLVRILVTSCANVGGSIEEFAQACLDAGKTSGVIKVDARLTNVRYNGVVPNCDRFDITFSGDTYTVEEKNY